MKAEGRRQKAEGIELECRELHEYLLSKLDHKWRFDTWKDKYAARIRKYGIATCKRAIDGFCWPSNNWYMRTVAHRAPELIFRSDKALETFLAKAPEIEEGGHTGQGGHASPPIREQREKIEAFRRKLEFENSHLTARLHRRLRRSELKERLNYHSFYTWIKPLQFVGMENGTVVLFHEVPSWVQEHYAEAISEVLGKPVRVVNQMVNGEL